MKRKRKVLKAIDNLSIKDATATLLACLEDVAMESDHPEVFETVGKMLIEEGKGHLATAEILRIVREK